jgi:Tol biopolymer transport system component
MLVFTEIRAGRLDVGVVDIRAGDRLLLSSVANETRPDVSPDGRKLAYMSNELGRDEIFVRRMDDVAPDGRFLMLQDEANSTDEIHLIVNWFEELKRQLQAT